MAPGRLAHLRGGSAQAEAGAAASASAAVAAVGAAAGRLLARAGLRRCPHSPVLPALGRHKGPSLRPGSGGRLPRALALVAVALLAASIAAAVSAAAVALYAHSILHEPPEAVAAAAAEAQAAAALPEAVAAAAARASRLWAAAGPAPPLQAAAGAAEGGVDPLQLGAPAPHELLREGQEASPQGELLTANYTVVVMSYAARLPSLPLVITQLGSCPSAAEVLLVWNGPDPPAPALFAASRAPVRVRQEAAHDLSNRLRPDPGIHTTALFLSDDDLLLRCADVERAFARWQGQQQALVGFFPRLAAAGPPPQYLGEKAVFRQRRYTAMLTAAEFVSLNLLRRYWSDRYAPGRAVVLQRTNCEDILLNFVAAAAIRERAGAALVPVRADTAQPTAVPVPAPALAGGPASLRLDPLQLARPEPERRLLPQAVWVQPSRRLDISFLSGVGISRGRATHEAKRRQCVGLFASWWGEVLQEEAVVFDAAAPQQRWALRPLCWLPFLGCVYI